MTSTWTLLRPGTTCVEAITLLDCLTEQGLADLQNAVPHIFGDAAADMPQATR
ncbi:hypothetical protein [Streptomyces pseudoechinosporeus]